MAIVHCPECSKKLKVADTSVGKKVKCSCGQIFVAEPDDAAPKPVVAAAAEKVLVACSECSAKLKVAVTSLGKRMKCPKCTSVFVAALEEEAPPPPPVKKKAPPPRPVETDDEDDDSPFRDEEETPKAKAKPGKRSDPDDDEDDDDRPKSKFAKKPARSDDDEDEPIKKPVYPRRTVLNLFVFLLLIVFIAFFAGVYLDQIPLTFLPKAELPGAKGLKRDTKKNADDDKNENDPEAGDIKDRTELEGTWIVESAVAKGKPVPELDGASFVFAERTRVNPLVFAGGLLITPWNQDGSYYSVDFTQNPKRLDVEAPDKRPIPGIYKFDGEKLHWCMPAGTPKENDLKLLPPTSFDGNEFKLVILKRAIKDDGRHSRLKRQLDSSHNLKDIGIAIHNYAGTNNGRLPPAASSGSKDPNGKPLLSWRVAILPYIDQGALYKEFNLDLPWDDPHNHKLIAKMPKQYAMPSVKAGEGMTHYRTLVGPGTVLDPQKGKDGKLYARYKIGNVPDAGSNTFLVVEATEPTIWTKPDDLPFDPKGPLPKFGVAPNGFSVLLVDGSVQFVRSDVPEDVIRPYLTGDNGMPRRLFKSPVKGKDTWAAKDNGKQKDKDKITDKDKDKKADKDKQKDKDKEKDKDDAKDNFVGLLDGGGDGAPTWKVPEGWKEAKGTGFTVASFVVKEKDASAAITVSLLNGPAGGVLANVNRWRAQVKLEPWSEAELKKHAKKTTVSGADGTYVELVGASSSTLGVIVLHDNQAWFFKLTGDNDLAQREKGNFTKFLKSMKFR